MHVHYCLVQVRDATRDRLIGAAEQLFAERGVDGVSLPSSLSRAVFGRRIRHNHQSSFLGSILRARFAALNSNQLHPRPNELPVELSPTPRGCATSRFYRKVRL